MLEEMSAFFEARLEGYDAHMLANIQDARTFYPFTANLLPRKEGCRVLDLGCGTGLELEYYFAVNPTAEVCGIDLSEKMLDALRRKFPDRALELRTGSYFSLPFGEERFDAAVSVESLHHFTKDEKIPLYTKLRKALKPGGYFVLTDYFSLSDDEEALHRQEYLRLKEEQGLGDGQFYHYDTPLTVEHEREALLEAGFAAVEVLGNWGATVTLRAVRTP
ncbi:MAG: methyltransferase domain-containing protein [Clostridia bacterium]|nr:methyltransferase domain-containing protein [Clostridia bacterium]